jgi:fucose permease
MEVSTTVEARSRARPRRLLIILAFLAFISLGLPDTLIGVAWPSIATEVGIGLDALGLYLIASSVGYLAAAFTTGQLILRLGVGALLAVSTLATATALFGIAISPFWWLMIVLAALLGAGGGAIDSGLNTYAATNFSPRTMNWLHACYGIGATTGPAVMTFVLSQGFSWRLAYALVGGAQLVLMLCFVLTIKLWSNAPTAMSAAELHAPMMTTLRMPRVWLAALTFMVYVGLEVSASQWSFTLFTESRGVSLEVAGYWVSGYWGSLTLGRILIGLVANRIPGQKLMLVALGGALTSTLLIWLNPTTWLALGGLGLLGFSLATIFPTLMSDTPNRIGAAHVPNAIGLQMALSNLGVSVVPAIVGVIGTSLGLEWISFSLVVLAVMLIGLYLSLRGVGP